MHLAVVAETQSEEGPHGSSSRDGEVLEQEQIFAGGCSGEQGPKVPVLSTAEPL